MKAFHDLIINIGEGCCNKPHWNFIEGPDEPIRKWYMAYTLTTPINQGFRRLLNIVPDQPVDVLADGNFASVEILQGNSKFVIAPAVPVNPGDPVSTSTLIKCWAYGDGDLGDKVARVKCDAHRGEGVLDITTDIMWMVTLPDTTTLTVTEGADEPIPPA